MYFHVSSFVSETPATFQKTALILPYPLFPLLPLLSEFCSSPFSFFCSAFVISSHLYSYSSANILYSIIILLPSLCHFSATLFNVLSLSLSFHVLSFPMNISVPFRVSFFSTFSVLFFPSSFL